MTGGTTAGRDRIGTARLELVPLTPADAADMVEVLAGPELYAFIGGTPPGLAELRDRYTRWAVGGSADGTQEWHNWVLRRRQDQVAVGTVQATITDGGAAAEIAWVTGLRWQGCGYASEAVRALAGWLDARSVEVITAHIHPDHRASATVAERAGLRPTGEFTDGERRWRRERPAAR